MPYVKVNVEKPAKMSPGKGGDKKTIITFIDMDDLASEASRDAKGIVIAGNHTFKPDTYAIQVYGTIDSISGKANSEGEIDAEGFLQEVVFAHPGSEKEIREFRSNWINRNIMIIVERCSDGSKDQYGASCAPLRMKVEATDDKEANKSIFTFTSSNKGPDVAIYQGTITLPTPVVTIAPDAIDIDLSNGEGEYQLSDNTVATAIRTISNAEDGMVFTLLGSGGVNPSTISDDGTDFILHEGAGWTALAGARITFRVFKSGAAEFVAIEQSRTRHRFLFLS